VTFGDEQVELLTVRVSPQYSRSTPTGRVAVKSAMVPVCVMTVSSAKGSCALSRRRLDVGTYSLVASYEGSGNFDGSTSAKENLTVTK
jgi:hypothetical protein